VDTCDKDEDYPILVMKFYNNHSIRQCKKNLINLSFDMKKGTNRVIWAIGPTDELVKHSSMADRGSRSISFFHKRPKFNESEYEEIIHSFYYIS